MTFLRLDFLNKLGFTLITCYLLQWLVPFEVDRLLELQTNDDYKFWSGLALATLFASQWTLTYARVVLQREGQAFIKVVKAHKIVGSLSPILYYTHSCDPGYGFLFVLTFIFIINHILANINLDGLTLTMYNVWLSIHIFFSFVILILAISHIVIVFQFK